MSPRKKALDVKAVRYGTTTIDPSQTHAEIAAMVSKHGASRFEARWDGPRMDSLRFALRVGEREFPAALRAPTANVLKQLQAQNPGWTDDELLPIANRIAWRRLRHLLEQVLLLAAEGDFPVQQLLFGFAEGEDPATGELRPLFEVMLDHAATGAAGGLRYLPPASTSR